MGRFVSKIIACAAKKFDADSDKYGELLDVWNSCVYWSHETNTLVLVAPNEWVDYFNGKIEEPPTISFDGEFEFDESEFLKMLSGG